MKSTSLLKEEFQSKLHDDLLRDIYIDEELLDYQRNRYIEAISTFETIYGECEACIFSAPGRSEIGGNHTDHQHGQVLAAAINLDAIAIVKETMDDTVQVVSGDSPMITISLDNLDADKNEEGTTLSLVKGVLAGIKNSPLPLRPLSELL